MRRKALKRQRDLKDVIRKEGINHGQTLYERTEDV